MFRLSRIRRAYGVDLSPSRVVVVRALAGRRGVTHELLWEGAPTAAPLADVASAMAAEVASGRARTVCAVPAHEAVARWLTAPFPSVSRAWKVFPSLLDIQLPFPLETCVYQLVEVSRSDGQVRALAVAVRQDHLRARLETCRGAGVDPVVLDHEGLALWTQSIGELPPEAGMRRLVAYVGSDHSVLVLGRGPSFVAAHGCRCGWGDLMKSGHPEPQAVREFVDRARRVLQAELEGSAGQALQWIWTGPGAADAACVSALREALARGPDTTFATHREPGSFLARALAARALAAGPLRCDFRVGDWMHPQRKRMESAGQRRVAATYLALGLLLCGLGAGWRAALRQREAAVQTKLTSLALELTGGARIEHGQEVLLARRALENRKAQDAAFVEAVRPSLTVLLSGLLETARAGGLTLETLSLRRAEVSVTGSSEDWSGGRRIQQFLEANGFEVEFRPQEAVAEERVRFTLRGVARP